MVVKNDLDIFEGVLNMDPSDAKRLLVELESILDKLNVNGVNDKPALFDKKSIRILQKRAETLGKT